MYSSYYDRYSSYSQQKQRHKRAMEQPLYLLDKYYKTLCNGLDGCNNIIDRNEMVFKICGSTKNIYTVILKKRNENTANSITCDCPDFTSGCQKYKVICKHCCFVIYKVLQLIDNIYLPLDNGGQLELLDQHMLFMQNRFNTLVLNGNIFNKQLKDRYDSIKTHQDAEIGGGSTKTSITEKKPETYKNKFIYDGNMEEKKGEMCPICFDEFDLSKKVAMCPACKNILHLSCMKKWISMGKKTCVYCRNTIWKDYKKEEKKAKTNSGKTMTLSKYKNLM